MATFTDFYPSIMPYAPGCPTMVVDRAVLDMARDFCTITGCLRQTVTVPVTATQDKATIPVAAGYEVVDIKAAWWGNAALTPAQQDAFDLAPVRLAASTDSKPQYYTATASAIRLYPTPSITDATSLTVEVTVRPTLAATTIDDSLRDRFAVEIANGALWRVLRTPNQPFANTDLALQYKRMYDTGRSAARAFFNSGGQEARVAMRRWI